MDRIVKREALDDSLAKSLSLVINFEKVPQDLRNAVIEHHKNIKKVEDLKAQLSLVQKSLDEMIYVVEETNKKYRVALKNWDGTLEKDEKGNKK